MIWFGITAISPLLAFVCWYAKGNGKISLVLSAIIIAVLFNTTFVYGWIYFDIYSFLEAIVFICGLVILRRNTVKNTILMTALGIMIAIILDKIIPFHFG